MARSGRRRMGGGPGTGQWLVLGGAVLVILGLTFALGLLVGRQWARQSASTAGPSVSEAARKPATAARRSGIAAEAMVDRAPEPAEKLTFYQTLTEPLNGPAAAPRPEPKPVAIKPSPPAPAPPAQAPVPPAAAQVSRTASPSPVSLPPLASRTDSKASERKTADWGSAGVALRAAAEGEASASRVGPPQLNNAVPSAVTAGPMASATAPASAPHAAPNATASAPKAVPPSSAPATPPWTIQVGAYKGRRQAEDLREQLAAAGLDAYVAALSGENGQARFRVRVGTYRTREEAATAAERIRAQRSLTTFVTQK